MDVKNMKELPSPEQLRNKIVIKAKKYMHGGLPPSVTLPTENVSPSSSPILEKEEQLNGKSPILNPPVIPSTDVSEKVT
jgi:hypothetical protein